jgi:predicted dehydrogenase
MEVYGTEGSLMASSTGMMQLADVELRGAKGTDKAPERLPIPERLRWVPEGVPAGPAFNVAQMYQRFADGLRSGDPNEADFALALRRHRLLDTIERASETGRRHTVLP